MNIVITGGAGFLGVRLARTLLEKGQLALAGAAVAQIDQITLVDRAEPPADLAKNPKVEVVVGDLNELLDKSRVKVVPKGTDVLFHLAAAVSGECEADFDLGMRSNFAATHGLLEACRALGSQPTFVFASSLAVFGNSPEQPTPPLISDATLPTPQSSYGIQKFIGEQMVADYGRKGFVRGRTVRLMTVSVRPGRPNGAASSFLSGMIREPLAGVRSQVPVSPETEVALSSPGRTIAGLIRAAETDDKTWGPRTAVNLPAIKTTVREMADALDKVGGKEAASMLEWKIDPPIAKIVATWPGNVESPRANKLGLTADENFEAIVREYVRENPDAVKLQAKQ
ncbi:MAG: D-erythronate dehydrogenase [Burkholderiales bacterium]